MAQMLFSLPPVSFLAGILGAYFGQAQIVTLLYAVAALWIILRWVLLDAASRQTRVSWPMRIGLVALTTLVLPWYFFRSRGWKGGFRLLARAWLLFAISMVCYRLGYRLT